MIKYVCILGDPRINTHSFIFSFDRGAVNVALSKERRANLNIFGYFFVNHFV